MTRPISEISRWWALALLVFASVLFPGAASAVPSYCVCPSSFTSSQGGSLRQLTCDGLEANLYANLRSFANSHCGQCGACFYSYTTDYPSCTIIDGYYTQSGNLTYACGIYVGPNN